MADAPKPIGIKQALRELKQARHFASLWKEVARAKAKHTKEVLKVLRKAKSDQRIADSMVTDLLRVNKDQQWLLDNLVQEWERSGQPVEPGLKYAIEELQSRTRQVQARNGVGTQPKTPRTMNYPLMNSIPVRIPTIYDTPDQLLYKPKGAWKTKDDSPYKDPGNGDPYNSLGDRFNPTERD